MAIMPKTQREQLMALLGILGLAAAGLYYYYVFRPQSTTLADTQKKVEASEKRNQDAKAELAKGTANELRAQAQMYLDNLQLMRQLVPASNEVPTLLDQISNSARRVGLDIGRIAPLPMEEGNDFNAVKYQLTLNGSYHAVAEFLANVASLTRIVVPVNLNLQTVQQNPGPTRSVAATFELHTYVARTTPRPPPPPPKSDKSGDAQKKGD